MVYSQHTIVIVKFYSYVQKPAQSSPNPLYSVQSHVSVIRMKSALYIFTAPSELLLYLPGNVPSVCVLLYGTDTLI